MTTYSANSVSSLNTAIADADAATTGTITIDISGTINLGSTALDAINLASGVTLDIVGTNNAEINGGGTEQGFFVYAGNVDISNLTIANTKAQGGNGASGGGGGAGLGGGLFIADNTAGGAAAPGNVTLDNVTFTNDSAIGGKGSTNTNKGGGGGGLDGGNGGGGVSGGGGGIGLGANGSSGGSTPGAGIVIGAGNDGGGGGSAIKPYEVIYGGGGGIGATGGSGGFGGGGGNGPGGGGGFGGGGGLGSGGFGGGGGSVSEGDFSGGFGGGSSGSSGGGGGLGAGGDIFVMQGATLTFVGGTASAGTVAGGSGKTGEHGSANGSAFGNGIFLQGNEQITLGKGQTAGQTTTISGVIADEHGSVASDGNQGSLLINGAGTVDLTAANTFTGGITLDSGTLELGNNSAAGTGAIAFSGSSAELKLDSGATIANTLTNIASGDTIDLAGLAYKAGATAAYSSGTLTVTSGSASNGFALTNALSTGFSVSNDGSGGSLVTALPLPTISSPAAVQYAGVGTTTLKPFAGVTIGDTNPGASETLTLTLSGTGGALSGNGLNNTGNGVYTLSGTATAVTAALDALTFSAGTGIPNTLDPVAITLADQSSAGTMATASTTVTVVPTSFTGVSTAAQLSQDIAAIDLASQTTGGNGTAYSITLAANATLSEFADLSAINLKGTDSLTLNGNGATLDGASKYLGFFVYSGTVDINNLTISNTVAQGGNGASGGDGGAGLGGGLFIANDSANPAGTAGSNPGNVTLTNVTFTGDTAKGGTGGSHGPDVSAGGGLDGGNGTAGSQGGGGGIGLGANGSSAGAGPGAGIVIGAGNNGGGGGAGAGGGGIGASGLKGGFGGGGGGSIGSGGFGGGGAYDGSGGFGGGGSGFGGGAGGTGGGGGGLGAGGDIFVMQGASLTIEGGNAEAGTVAGGPGGGGNGFAYGNGIFLQGNEQIALGTGQTAGHTTTISGVIADEHGSVSSDANKGSLLINGAGIVDLAAANTFTGGITLTSGTLELGNNSAGGTGALAFNGASATLKLDAAVLTNNAYSGTIINFAKGDTIDLAGLSPIGVTASYSGTTLTAGGDKLTSITLASGLTIGTGGLFIATASDGNGGTDVTLVNDTGPVVKITSAAETSSAANQTINGTVTSGGPAIAGQTVTLKDNGALLGTATTTATGSFSASVTLLNIGANNIVASFTDSNNVPGASAAVTDTLTVAPAITYTPETLSTTYGSSTPVKPFSTLLVTDANPGATDTVFVSISGPGTLSDGSTDHNLTAAGTYGTTTFYTISGQSPAAAASELDALVFTPGNVALNSSQTSLFYIGVQSSAGTSAQPASAVTNLTVNNPADTINGSLGGYATIEGTSGTDIINANGSYNTIYSNGGNDVINAGSGVATVYAGPGNVTVKLNGYLNNVSGGNGNETISGGAGNATVNLGNGINSVTLGGLGNSITVGTGTNTISAGAGLDTIVAGAGKDTITLAGGNNNVTLNGGTDMLTYSGTNSVVNVNGNTAISITDLGSALRLAVGSSTQTDTLTGFGTTDPYAVVDLKNGVGGYTSVSAIVNALHSDGHGGTALTLGPTGSIDFVNTAQNQLHASNFAIG